MLFSTIHVPRRLWKLALVGTSLLTLALCRPALAQPPSPTPFVRFAELDVDNARLEEFRKAALENGEATLRLEPGVLAFHAVAEKGNPGRVRVFEMYVDAQAYQAHVQTSHFQKFRAQTDTMMLRRELHEAVPVRLGAKKSLPSRPPHVRVAELTIDPAQLQAYKDAVSEEIDISIRVEPGVLGIYAFALKEQPAQLRFVEIYADEAAYRQHIDSPHFKKYVEATKSMITSRTLLEAEPVFLGLSPAAKAPAYYVSEFELTDPEGIKPYSAQVEATFRPFGGYYFVRGGKVSALEGEPAKRIVMIAFPSLERAQAWYDSPQYREIRPIRSRSAKSRVYIVEGAPP
jgi:quinol monooxygenase YgiN/uncharacterized protein (DUF1330 family)